MIVVSDAGPLHYLIQIGKADLLHLLFGEVLIPHSVRDEVVHANVPTEVQAWLESPPSWAIIATAAVNRPFSLGKGESEAICLALDRKADLILLDDKKARRIAEEQGLVVTGTLGILLVAHERGLVKMPEAIQDLLRSGFRLSEKLIQQIVADLEQRR